MTTAQLLSIIAINTNFRYSKPTYHSPIAARWQLSSCTKMVHNRNKRSKHSKEKSLRMGNPNPKQDRAGVITALVVTGFGIGWLAGLSISPVVSIVITGVSGAAGAVVAAPAH